MLIYARSRMSKSFHLIRSSITEPLLQIDLQFPNAKLVGPGFKVIWPHDNSGRRYRHRHRYYGNIIQAIVTQIVH